MKLFSWGRTDTGRKREHNEDSFVNAPGISLFAVADGMGGHQGGEQASRLACEVLRSEVEQSNGDHRSISERLDAANRRTDEGEAMVADFDDDTIEVIASPAALRGASAATVTMAVAARRASSTVFNAAVARPELRGMGTTLTGMLFHDGNMHFCHAGDSRAYLLRRGSLTQLTEDHSWIQEQIRAGYMTPSEARESQFRHIITRSVGYERHVDVDTAEIPVEPGDCFLLCSDGLTNYIDGEELAETMDRAWYSQLPESLISLANDRGGDDNITVVVVYAANHRV